MLWFLVFPKVNGPLVIYFASIFLFVFLLIFITCQLDIRMLYLLEFLIANKAILSDKHLYAVAFLLELVRVDILSTFDFDGIARTLDTATHHDNIGTQLLENWVHVFCGKDVIEHRAKDVSDGELLLLLGLIRKRFL